MSTFAQPQTPADVMALSLQDRLAFFKGLTQTSAQIAALVVRTVLQDVRPLLAPAYYAAIRHLVHGADGREVFVQAIRYVNTAKATPERLGMHQRMRAELHDLLAGSGHKHAYIWRGNGGLRFFGTLAWPTAVEVEAALEKDDMIVYHRGDVVSQRSSSNGRWPAVIVATRVELDAATLPDTLGI